jgi:Transcriptional regulator, AbiEi antitoxin/REase_MTES_1575
MAKGVSRSTGPIREQTDTPLDLSVALIAADQHGQITRRQLRACGLDDKAIARRVSSGRLHRVYRGVYAVGHAGVTIEGRFMAAVLACGATACLSHLSAAAHLEFMPWEERLPEVTILGTSRRRVDGLLVHNARSLHWRDTMLHKGVRVTSPARTLLDVAMVLPPKALQRAARRAQASHRVSVRQLLECIERSNGHPGTSWLKAVIADGPAPTRSELEDLLLDLLDAAAIERPEINAPLRFDAATIVPDFLWRTKRVAIEADSERWHGHKLTREHDAAKQAILEAHGWRVLRIDYQQVERSPQQTLTRIRAALATLAP